MIDVEAANAVGNSSSSVHVDENNDSTDDANEPDDSSSIINQTSTLDYQYDEGHSNGSDGASGLQQHDTGNPLALLVLMLLTLILPLRRKK